jgi:hypothetical protein
MEVALAVVGAAPQNGRYLLLLLPPRMASPAATGTGTPCRGRRGWLSSPPVGKRGSVSGARVTVGARAAAAAIVFDDEKHAHGDAAAALPVPITPM